MIALFNLIIFQPLLNLLIWLYHVIPGSDFGFAIIALTILVKLVLYPLSASQIKQQRALQELQPKMDEIRKRLKDDKEAQAKELMELYRREKVNPAASCLPLLIQLPIFIGLFQALREGLSSHSLNLLYPFIANPGVVNKMFLGFVDLSQPNYILAILGGAVQFWQSWQLFRKPSPTTPPPADVKGQAGTKDESMAAMMNKQMMYVMPIMTVVIGFTLPGGLTLYLLVMSLLTVAQQALFLKKPQPPKAEAQLQQ
ncbi:MAG: YidC/Oxa1 family membrane protein insertase [Patescibacteria group bacterium]